ncbi:MAG: hypothetical protein DMF89_05155 [Acidobacteria bacterium]|nr:MAG: hypothetical protein DMF89_05155 [Acidobacteriota bacterium]
MTMLDRKTTRLALLLAVLLAAFPTRPLHAQALQTFEGVLTIVWGDPHPDLGGRGDVRYTLVLPDGTQMSLQMGGHEGEAVQLVGGRVLVLARVATTPAAAAGVPAPVAVVDSIALSPNALALPGPAGAVLGTRRVIYLLVKFSDATAEPHPPTFYTNMTNPDTPPGGEVFPSTLNGFFKKTSWNQFSWIGDVGGAGGLGAPFGWLTLPHPKSYYAPCGWSSSCAQLGLLGNDATALGRAQGINFATYDNINFVLSNDLDCCAWGGGYYSSIDAKVFGATWEPPWGQDVPTYAHEMGHSIGLPHSGWVYYAYDSPWDVMSSVVGINGVACGSYNSINLGSASTVYCSEPGDGYIAPHKDYLGWIPPANEVIGSPSGTTVTLEADSLPLGTAAKMIKVCLPGFACTGSSARYITVEARVKGLGATSQYDNGIPGEGVIIHEVRLDRPPIEGACFFNSQSGWAVPIDATPGDYDSVNCNSGGLGYPSYGLYNAQWTAGRTFVNTGYGLAIAVVSRSGSTFQINISAPGRHPSRNDDLDGDGRKDLVWRQTQSGDVAAWLMNGTSVKQGPVIAAGVPLAWQIVGMGDLDGDTNADLVWRNTQTGDVAAWLMNGAAVKQGPVIAAGVPLAWQIVGMGDLDGDSKADLVWRNMQTGDVAAWLMNGVSVNQGPVIAAGVPLVWQIVGIGDLDGDGKADLVWRNTQTGDVAAWLMNGVAVNQAPVIAAGVSPAWQIAGVGDLDADGKADLLWRQIQTGDVAAWLMNGTAVTQRPIVASQVPLVWQIASLGDVDGDGKADVIWRQTQTGDLAVWIMDGTAVRQQPVIAPGVPMVWQVQR